MQYAFIHTGHSQRLHDNSLMQIHVTGYSALHCIHCKRYLYVMQLLPVRACSINVNGKNSCINHNLENINVECLV